ncbi:unnamed protein product [Rhodiola kirilowii]
MEVPVINRVGDLQLGIGRVPTLISQVLIEQVPEIFSLWKWGAVILAVYAIVNSLLVRLKLVLVRFKNRQSAVTKSLLSYSSEDDDDYSSDDDDNVSVSSSSVNEDEYEDEEEEEEKVKDRNGGVFGSFFDFRVACSSSFEKEERETTSKSTDLPRRFSWSNFANGKCVVKLWDEIEPITSVILSAGKDEAGDLIVSLADSRIGRESILLNWNASEFVNSRSAAVRSDGLRKVYFRDEAGEKLKVVDLRKATEAFDEVTTEWWDADGGDDVAGL